MLFLLRTVASTEKLVQRQTKALDCFPLPNLMDHHCKLYEA